MATNEGSILSNNAFLKELGAEILPSLSLTLKFQFRHTSKTHLVSSVVLKSKTPLHAAFQNGSRIVILVQRFVCYLATFFLQFQQIYCC